MEEAKQLSTVSRLALSEIGKTGQSEKVTHSINMTINPIKSRRC